MNGGGEIEVIISDDGQVTFHVQGVKGSSCTALTKELEKMVGKTEKTTKTSEYYEERVRIKSRNGEQEQ